MFNLANSLKNSAEKIPSRVAIVHAERSITYSELYEKARRFANALKDLGIKPQDKVALILTNSMEFTIAYYGILISGAVVVPMNFQLKYEEIAYQLNDSDSKTVVFASDFEEQVVQGMKKAGAKNGIMVRGTPSKELLAFDELIARSSPETGPRQTSENDTAVIIYTSGTTGRPKGAELTHSNLSLNAGAMTGKLLKLTKEDVLLAVLPLFHSFGQTCVQNASICNGTQIVMMERFDPLKVLETLQNNKVTIFCGVPTMYFVLLQVPERKQFNISSLRMCISGGAAMPVEVMKNFEKEFGGVILEGYGLSETSPVVSFNFSAEQRKPGSIGLPLHGVEIKIVDDNDKEVETGEIGEIIVRGYNVMKGYYKKPEETKEAMKNGWFHTGDLGKKDEDGFIFIVDRKKEMIIRGGMNIYPREVEEVLYSLKGVTEAAVLGVPDEKYGEEVKAFIVLAAGVELKGEEIIEYCKSRLASYKCPKSVEFKNSLPKGSTGKILKRALRK